MNQPIIPNSLRNTLDLSIPLVVSYGMGVDSTALLVGLWSEGIRPDMILFADTGSENQLTYDYLDTINAWLRSVGFPEVTVVRYTPKRFKWNVYSTLEGNCISNRTLPSLAFGRKSCSLKWKGGPLDKAVEAKYGSGAVYRAIGYDCSPADNKRFAHAKGKTDSGSGQSRQGDRFIYPLQTWGWRRDDCKAIIAQAGLPVPPKSSCYFCPAMKKDEVSGLPVNKLRKIVIMEANAQPNLKTVVGLWRGKSMTDYIRAEKLLPEAEIGALWSFWSRPERIIARNEQVSEHVLEEAASTLDSRQHVR
jgi:3'-phosphoadenosine 5'-phosphosulfate sulfotransferase (PAPS reductase)/FAD synthetase